jgi:hypothetical protein
MAALPHSADRVAIMNPYSKNVLTETVIGVFISETQKISTPKITNYPGTMFMCIRKQACFV